MATRARQRLARRQFLTRTAAGLAGAALAASAVGGPSPGQLRAGEGVVDITPPLGIELGGFHRKPGNERRVRAIRQRPLARALVLEQGKVRAAICSLEVACVGRELADGIRAEVARKTGIPAEHVRVTCTHTHSMPAFCFLRQWGTIPKKYMATVHKRAVEAVCQAQGDLAPAELLVGTSRAVGGNHNRTTRAYRTDKEFGPEATDAARWLDTTVHAVLLPRAGKRTLCWYHFSAHPVCYADEEAGPDWPGEVAERVRQNEKLDPGFLQGHCGDVNPGDGRDWRGEIRQSVAAIYPAVKEAIAQARPVPCLPLRSLREEFRLPYDLQRFCSWLAQYRRDPKACATGEWVDAGFAEDWYRGNVGRDLKETHLPIFLSALRLGDLAMVFHPTELYSFYGLAIRRDAPFRHTLVVGYTDDMVGYLPDPKAYEAGEYAAVTVPKILDYPPYDPTAARQMTAAAVKLLARLR